MRPISRRINFDQSALNYFITNVESERAKLVLALGRCSCGASRRARRIKTMQTRGQRRRATELCLFVWFTSRAALDDCRIFVIPASVVDAAVRKSHSHWHSHLRRDGATHKDAGRHFFAWPATSRPEIWPAALPRIGRSMKMLGLTGALIEKRRPVGASFRDHDLQLITQQFSSAQASRGAAQ